MADANDELEMRIRQFAEVTATDEALAHYMLQENDYDLDRAINSFYANADAAQPPPVIEVLAEQQEPQQQELANEPNNDVRNEAYEQQPIDSAENEIEGMPENDESSTVSVMSISSDNDDKEQVEVEQEEGTSSSMNVLTKNADRLNDGTPNKKSQQQQPTVADLDLERKRKRARSPSTQMQSSSNNGETQPNKEKEFPEELVMLSWNIDGLDDRYRIKRFTAVLYIIAKQNPEVIFLQEMIPHLMPDLNNLMGPMYHVIPQEPNCGTYFCVTLVSKDIKITHKETIPFENSLMGRGMLIVEAEWQGLKLKLLNTHLESTKDCSTQRSNQFARCIERVIYMSASNPNETLAIFGGDLNIREKEIGVIPAAIKDVWMAAGSSELDKYTWDLSRNDNHTYGNGRFKPKYRFDRIYFAGSPAYHNVQFQLDGTSRIKGPNCFASDHFALVAKFTNANAKNKNVENPSKKRQAMEDGTGAGPSHGNIQGGSSNGKTSKNSNSAEFRRFGNELLMEPVGNAAGDNTDE